MAIEMFVRIDGVSGGSRSYHHKGWADVLSWKWGLDSVAAGSEAPLKTRMNEIRIIKTVGADSPGLMRLFAEGAIAKTAAISAVPQVGKRDAQQKYIAITLEDVRVKSINTGGSGEESVFTEEVTLEFGKINYEFFEYGAAGTDGKALPPTTYAFGWDVAANAACEFAG